MAYFDISSNDIETKDYNEKAIQTSVLNILNTRLGELPGLPEFGCRIQDFLFNMADIELKVAIRNEIKYVLARWEDRIEVNDVIVDIDYDYNKVVTKIDYRIKNDIRDEYSSRFIVFTMSRR